MPVSKTSRCWKNRRPRSIHGSKSPASKWRKQVKVGDLVLVVDVGGGTTDFSLIAVGEEEGSLTLHRIAVGEHILLGGDNMDLALAHAVSERLAGEGTKLDNWQLRGLAHSCREAKEKLLDRRIVAELPLAILGRGSSVIGKSIKTKISREEVAKVVLEGFFSRCEPTDRPAKAMRMGLQELGLSYAADPSVSRHLARFLDKENLSASKDQPVHDQGQSLRASYGDSFQRRRDESTDPLRPHYRSAQRLA